MSEQDISMVERCARAMYEREIFLMALTGAIPWRAHQENQREIWRGRVRVCIAAMRTPTEAMKRAGVAALEHSRGSYHDDLAVQEIHGAMIDACLQEQT